jgi:glutaminyl-tRNA synthetase
MRRGAEASNSSRMHASSMPISTLKVTIDNYPDGQVEKLNSPNHPKDEAMGKREIPFTQDVYIDQNDFLEVAPNKKFKRLVAGG